MMCLYFLVFNREVPMKEAKEFAESIAAIFIETSARNAVNVEELFQKISKFFFFFSLICILCEYIFNSILSFFVKHFEGSVDRNGAKCYIVCWNLVIFLQDSNKFEGTGLYLEKMFREYKTKIISEDKPIKRL